MRNINSPTWETRKLRVSTGVARVVVFCGRVLLLCWMMTGVAAADETAAARSVTLTMEFFYGGTKIADVTDRLQLAADGSYTLASHAAAVGVAQLLHGDSRFESRGRVDAAHGLLMTLYTDQRGRRDPRRAMLSAGGRLHLSRGDESREETITEPLFDYLSAVYRSYVLGRPAGGKIKFTNGWRLTDYDYVNAGMETVSTGLGEMEAVLLRRDSDRGTRKIWLAPALDYLPVRLHVSDKGHEFTTVLTGIAPARPQIE